VTAIAQRLFADLLVTGSIPRRDPKTRFQRSHAEHGSTPLRGGVDSASRTTSPPSSKCDCWASLGQGDGRTKRAAERARRKTPTRISGFGMTTA
jgi:hypothetical protein